MTPQTTENHTAELRATYLGAVPHTLYTALVWVSAGIIGYYGSSSTAILFFIVAGSFTFPGGELLRKAFHAPNVISKENKLPEFFMLLAFTIPLCYPLIYLISKNNIALFFPSFMVLVGAHYLPFVYGYGMKTFAALSLILVATGTYLGIFKPVGFSLPAIITGIILIGFALLHYILLKKELI